MDVLRRGEGAESPPDPRLRGLPRVRQPARAARSPPTPPGRTRISCCSPRTAPATATSSSCPRSGSSRGSTGGRASTGRCSSGTRKGSSASPPASREKSRSTCGQGNYEAAQGERRSTSRGCSGPTASGSKSRTTASPRRDVVTDRDVPPRRRSWASRSSRPTTPTTCARKTPKRTTCCSPSAPGRTWTTRKRFRFFGQESYVKSEKEMKPLFPGRPEVLAETARVAELCEFDFEKRYFLPQYPAPGRSSRPTTICWCTSPGPGRAERYGDPLPPAVDERLRLRAGRHPAHRLRRLLPDRLRPHQGGARPRHPRGPGARLGGRLARRLRPAHHQRRSAALRPAVRAVPESRADLDAGYRPRLLLRAPRRSDRVRPRALRARVGRADHHLRDA